MANKDSLISQITNNNRAPNDKDATSILSSYIFVLETDLFSSEKFCKWVGGHPFDFKSICDVYIHNDDLFYAACYGIYSCNTDILINVLINSSNGMFCLNKSNNISPLHYLFAKGNNNLIHFVLGFNKNLNLNVQDKFGLTPLMIACYFNHSTLLEELLISYPQIELGNKHAFDVSIKDTYGKTASHYASFHPELNKFQPLLRDTKYNYSPLIISPFKNKIYTVAYFLLLLFVLICSICFYISVNNINLFVNSLPSIHLPSLTSLPTASLYSSQSISSSTNIANELDLFAALSIRTENPSCRISRDFLSDDGYRVLVSCPMSENSVKYSVTAREKYDLDGENGGERERFVTFKNQHTDGATADRVAWEICRWVRNKKNDGGLSVLQGIKNFGLKRRKEGSSNDYLLDEDKASEDGSAIDAFDDNLNSTTSDYSSFDKEPDIDNGSSDFIYICDTVKFITIRSLGPRLQALTIHKDSTYPPSVNVAVSSSSSETEYSVSIASHRPSTFRASVPKNHKVSFTSFSASYSNTDELIVLPTLPSALVQIYLISPLQERKVIIVRWSTRDFSTIAVLGSINFSSGNLLPPFSPTVSNYRLNIPYKQDRRFVEIVTKTHSASVISINGGEAVNTTSLSAVIPKHQSSSRDELLVSVRTSNSMRVYKIMVEWTSGVLEKKNPLLLRHLDGFGCELHETFHPQRLTYSALAQDRTTHVAFRFVTASSKNKISVFINGVPASPFQAGPFPEETVNSFEDMVDYFWGKESDENQNDSKFNIIPIKSSIKTAVQKHKSLHHQAPSNTWISTWIPISRDATEIIQIKIVSGSLSTTYIIALHRKGSFISRSSTIQAMSLITIGAGLLFNLPSITSLLSTFAFFQFINGLGKGPGMPMEFTEFTSHFSLLSPDGIRELSVTLFGEKTKEDAASVEEENLNDVLSSYSAMNFASEDSEVSKGLKLNWQREISKVNVPLSSKERQLQLSGCKYKISVEWLAVLKKKTPPQSYVSEAEIEEMKRLAKWSLLRWRDIQAASVLEQNCIQWTRANVFDYVSIADKVAVPFSVPINPLNNINRDIIDYSGTKVEKSNLYQFTQKSRPKSNEALNSLLDSATTMLVDEAIAHEYLPFGRRSLLSKGEDDEDLLMSNLSATLDNSPHNDEGIEDFIIRRLLPSLPSEIPPTSPLPIFIFSSNSSSRLSSIESDAWLRNLPSTLGKDFSKSFIAPVYFGWSMDDDSLSIPPFMKKREDEFHAFDALQRPIHQKMKDKAEEQLQAIKEAKNTSKTLFVSIIFIGLSGFILIMIYLIRWIGLTCWKKKNKQHHIVHSTNVSMSQPGQVRWRYLTPLAFTFLVVDLQMIQAASALFEIAGVDFEVGTVDFLIGFSIPFSFVFNVAYWGQYIPFIIIFSIFLYMAWHSKILIFNKDFNQYMTRFSKLARGIRSVSSIEIASMDNQVYITPVGIASSSHKEQATFSGADETKKDETQNKVGFYEVMPLRLNDFDPNLPCYRDIFLSHDPQSESDVDNDNEHKDEAEDIDKNIDYTTKNMVYVCKRLKAFVECRSPEIPSVSVLQHRIHFVIPHFVIPSCSILMHADKTIDKIDDEERGESGAKDVAESTKELQKIEFIGSDGSITIPLSLFLDEEKNCIPLFIPSIRAFYNFKSKRDKYISYISALNAYVSPSMEFSLSDDNSIDIIKWNSIVEKQQNLISRIKFNESVLSEIDDIHSLLTAANTNMNEVILSVTNEIQIQNLQPTSPLRHAFDEWLQDSNQVYPPTFTISSCALLPTWSQPEEFWWIWLSKHVSDPLIPNIEQMSSSSLTSLGSSSEVDDSILKENVWHWADEERSMSIIPIVDLRKQEVKVKLDSMRSLSTVKMSTENNNFEAVADSANFNNFRTVKNDQSLISCNEKHVKDNNSSIFSSFAQPSFFSIGHKHFLCPNPSGSFVPVEASITVDNIPSIIRNLPEMALWCSSSSLQQDDKELKHVTRDVNQGQLYTFVFTRALMLVQLFLSAKLSSPVEVLISMIVIAFGDFFLQVRMDSENVRNTNEFIAKNRSELEPNTFVFFRVPFNDSCLTGIPVSSSKNDSEERDLGLLVDLAKSWVPPSDLVLNNIDRTAFAPDSPFLPVHSKKTADETQNLNLGYFNLKNPSLVSLPSVDRSGNSLKTSFSSINTGDQTIEIDRIDVSKGLLVTGRILGKYSKHSHPFVGDYNIYTIEFTHPWNSDVTIRTMMPHPILKVSTKKRSLLRLFDIHNELYDPIRSVPPLCIHKFLMLTMFTFACLSYFDVLTTAYANLVMMFCVLFSVSLLNTSTSISSFFAFLRLSIRGVRLFELWHRWAQYLSLSNTFGNERIVNRVRLIFNEIGITDMKSKVDVFQSHQYLDEAQEGRQSTDLEDETDSAAHPRMTMLYKRTIIKTSSTEAPSFISSTRSIDNLINVLPLSLPSSALVGDLHKPYVSSCDRLNEVRKSSPIATIQITSENSHGSQIEKIMQNLQQIDSQNSEGNGITSQTFMHQVNHGGCDHVTSLLSHPLITAPHGSVQLNTQFPFPISHLLVLSAHRHSHQNLMQDHLTCSVDLSNCKLNISIDNSSLSRTLFSSTCLQESSSDLVGYFPCFSYSHAPLIIRVINLLIEERNRQGARRFVFNFQKFMNGSSIEQILDANVFESELQPILSVLEGLSSNDDIEAALLGLPLYKNTGDNVDKKAKKMKLITEANVHAHVTQFIKRWWFIPISLLIPSLRIQLVYPSTQSIETNSDNINVWLAADFERDDEIILSLLSAIRNSQHNVKINGLNHISSFCTGLESFLNPSKTKDITTHKLILCGFSLNISAYKVLHKAVDHKSKWDRFVDDAANIYSLMIMIGRNKLFDFISEVVQSFSIIKYHVNFIYQIDKTEEEINKDKLRVSSVIDPLKNEFHIPKLEQPLLVRIFIKLSSFLSYLSPKSTTSFRNITSQKPDVKLINGTPNILDDQNDTTIPLIDTSTPIPTPRGNQISFLLAKSTVNPSLNEHEDVIVNEDSVNYNYGSKDNLGNDKAKYGPSVLPFVQDSLLSIGLLLSPHDTLMSVGIHPMLSSHGFRSKEKIFLSIDKKSAMSSVKFKDSLTGVSDEAVEADSIEEDEPSKDNSEDADAAAQALANNSFTQPKQSDGPADPAFDLMNMLNSELAVPFSDLFDEDSNLYAWDDSDLLMFDAHSSDFVFCDPVCPTLRDQRRLVDDKRAMEMPPSDVPLPKSFWGGHILYVRQPLHGIRMWMKKCDVLIRKFREITNTSVGLLGILELKTSIFQKQTLSSELNVSIDQLVDGAKHAVRNLMVEMEELVFELLSPDTRQRIDFARERIFLSRLKHFSEFNNLSEDEKHQIKKQNYYQSELIKSNFITKLNQFENNLRKFVSNSANEISSISSIESIWDRNTSIFAVNNAQRNSNTATDFDKLIMYEFLLETQKDNQTHSNFPLQPHHISSSIWSDKLVEQSKQSLHTVRQELVLKQKKFNERQNKIAEDNLSDDDIDDPIDNQTTFFNRLTNLALMGYDYAYERALEFFQDKTATVWNTIVSFVNSRIGLDLNLMSRKSHEYDLLDGGIMNEEIIDDDNEVSDNSEFQMKCEVTSNLVKLLWYTNAAINTCSHHVRSYKEEFFNLQQEKKSLEGRKDIGTSSYYPHERKSNNSESFSDGSVSKRSASSELRHKELENSSYVLDAQEPMSRGCFSISNTLRTNIIESFNSGYNMQFENVEYEKVQSMMEKLHLSSKEKKRMSDEINQLKNTFYKLFELIPFFSFIDNAHAQCFQANENYQKSMSVIDSITDRCHGLYKDMKLSTSSNTEAPLIEKDVSHASRRYTRGSVLHLSQKLSKIEVCFSQEDQKMYDQAVREKKQSSFILFEFCRTMREVSKYYNQQFIKETRSGCVEDEIEQFEIIHLINKSIIGLSSDADSFSTLVDEDGAEHFYQKSKAIPDFPYTMNGIDLESIPFSDYFYKRSIRYLSPIFELLYKDIELCESGSPDRNFTISTQSEIGCGYIEDLINSYLKHTVFSSFSSILSLTNQRILQRIKGRLSADSINELIVQLMNFSLSSLPLKNPLDIYNPIPPSPTCWMTLAGIFVSPEGKSTISGTDVTIWSAKKKTSIFVYIPFIFTSFFKGISIIIHTIVQLTLHSDNLLQPISDPPILHPTYEEEKMMINWTHFSELTRQFLSLPLNLECITGTKNIVHQIQEILEEDFNVSKSYTSNTISDQKSRIHLAMYKIVSLIETTRVSHAWQQKQNNQDRSAKNSTFRSEYENRIFMARSSFFKKITDIDAQINHSQKILENFIKHDLGIETFTSSCSSRLQSSSNTFSALPFPCNFTGNAHNNESNSLRTFQQTHKSIKFLRDFRVCLKTSLEASAKFNNVPPILHMIIPLDFLLPNILQVGDNNDNEHNQHLLLNSDDSSNIYSCPPLKFPTIRSAFKFKWRKPQSLDSGTYVSRIICGVGFEILSGCFRLHLRTSTASDLLFDAGVYIDNYEQHKKTENQIYIPRFISIDIRKCHVKFINRISHQSNVFRIFFNDKSQLGEKICVPHHTSASFTAIIGGKRSNPEFNLANKLSQWICQNISANKELFAGNYLEFAVEDNSNADILHQILLSSSLSFANAPSDHVENQLTI